MQNNYTTINYKYLKNYKYMSLNTIENTITQHYTGKLEKLLL